MVTEIRFTASRVTKTDHVDPYRGLYERSMNKRRGRYHSWTALSAVLLAWAGAEVAHHEGGYDYISEEAVLSAITLFTLVVILRHIAPYMSKSLRSHLNIDDIRAEEVKQWKEEGESPMPDTRRNLI